MIPRYRHEGVALIWSDENKLLQWQNVELAVIKAKELLGIFPRGTYKKIKKNLDVVIDVEWWKKKDDEIHHDLNAFLDERLRYIPDELHQYWHAKMTSYDTEEPATSLMLLDSIEIVEQAINVMLEILKEKALKYQHTPMMGRSHGQVGKIQSFGKRIYDWRVNLILAKKELQHAKTSIKFSKLSGAMGNYQGLTPKEEKQALAILGLKPFKGATQIMPRIIHQPLANALVMVVGALTQIAVDIKLGARSGNPICHEPFKKLQKGSSAMPHKKNTIRCENQEGMFKAAKGFQNMLHDCMVTWEERSIEQSSPERIAWPDLFHVVMNSFKNMKRVVSGMAVFEDNMLKEIKDTLGCYASEDAKDFLKEKGAKYGLSHEDAYRIVQLAAFQAFQLQVSGKRLDMRGKGFKSVKHAEKSMLNLNFQGYGLNIKQIIISSLRPHDELGVTKKEVDRWKKIIAKIYAENSNINEWEKIFKPAYHLRGESVFFKQLKRQK